MKPPTHRSPGMMEALVDSDAFCELICDGVHVHPTFVRMLRRLVGESRLVLITDAVAWSGMPDGEYRSAGEAVQLRDGGVFLAGTETLAGSRLTMDEALRRYASWTGAGLAELAAVSSGNAARMLGMGGRIGRIAPGMAADLVVLDQHCGCVAVMCSGQWLRQPGHPAPRGGPGRGSDDDAMTCCRGQSKSQKPSP
jgi:N-acetylglucosamine-6-phosphate deacetylase